ncbi:MAG: PKD domain-containing protein [Candidatus Bipolaricaulis sp.]|nr:PKD domain-containing protein [Candidatus Bipolaricaulis sp.]
MRMTREQNKNVRRGRAPVLVALAVVLAVGCAGLGQVEIVALDADRAAWDAVVAQAAGAGLAATVKDYNEAALYNQVYLLVGIGMARFDVAQALTTWAPNVAPRFADLTPYVPQLQAAGLEIYRYGGRAIGVVLPWRAESFAGVSARSTRVNESVQLLTYLPAGGTRAPEAKRGGVPLSIGPVTITKTEKRNPHVDGALETFVAATRQVVSTGVLTALSKVPAQARDALTKVAGMLGIPLSPAGDAVTLVIESKGGVAPLGVAVEPVSSPLGLTKVSVPLSQLESFLAQVGPGVYVRLPYTPHELAVTSQGASLIGAPAFHSAGIRGSGVKVAVIDLGFSGLATSQAQGDLPYSVVTRDFTGTGIETGISHGTAVAEIVYDIAPDAQLYLVKIGNEVDLDNAVTYCISEGIHIINHSLGWYNTNFYDGTGTIADIARRATSAGILWVQAAGNSGQKHYGATFTDGNSDGWHDTDVTFTATAGQQIAFYLTWDAWPATGDDYDLYLYGPTGALVASSTATQGGTEQPTERITTTAGSSGTYRVRIQKASGATRRLSLFSIVHDLTPAVSASSMPAPANAAEVLSVGAINWANYATGPIAAYSSRGPTGDGRAKPDLAAPDNVTTGMGYYNPFPGTSAAAPHVAGIAALLKAEAPSLNRSSLTSRILSFCVPMGDPYAFGAGRLEARPQGPTAQPDLVVDNITYSPTMPTLGSTVTFQVTVRNQGTASAGSFTVRLQGVASYQDATVSSLAAGASTTRTFTLPLSTSPETFTATADVNGQVSESDEANNTRQVTVTGPVARPDLVVDNITYTPTTPNLGQTITFQVTVRNQGTASAGSFTVRLQGAATYQDATVSSLAAGASTTRTFTLPLSTSPETFTATADTNGQVTESDEANNQRQVMITAAVPALGFTVATNKSTYTVGEPVRVTVTLSRASYVYLIELDAAGRAVFIFPNRWEPSPQLPAGTTQLPRTTAYAYTTSEPAGSEQIVGFASDRAIPYFPTSYGTGFPILATNGALFLSQVRSWLAANVPTGSWAEASAPFTIVLPTNQPPTASFTFSPTNPLVNQWITFDGRASSDPDGTITSWAWDFGDGATGTGSQIQKRYSSGGTYTVALTVTDNRGATATTTRTVVVGTPNQPPTASFTFSPPNPDPGENVTFNAAASSDPDGTITAYSWNFGDGTTGTGVNITKAYTSAGTYVVTLTVTDNLGATGTTTRTIQVGTPPPPPPTLPGMPTIDKPGIYVWGDPENHWHVTIAGDASWTAPRKFQVVLTTATRGQFRNFVVTPAASAPAPGQQVRWEGTVGAGWIDLRFDLSGATTITMSVYLDTDGDGVLVPARAEDAARLVFLRSCKVNPPGVPFFLSVVANLGKLVPSQNFLVGFVRVRPDDVVQEYIEELERQAGCR